MKRLLKCQGYLDGLTIDRREAMALERILARPDSTDMEPVTCMSDAAAADRNEGTGSYQVSSYRVQCLTTT